jgi:hypothetical protein
MCWRTIIQREQAMYAPSRIALIVSVALVAATSSAANSSGDDKGLRFNSAGVLDLANRSQKIAAGRAVAVVELAAEDAAEIFSAAEQGEAQPVLRFSDYEFGCAKPARKCSLEQERKLLEVAGAAAKRDGKRLTITPASGMPVTFIDWTVAATKSADGDDETHWYLGRMPANGYQRVEVRFGHDAPGDFLINPQSGKVAFVHNGADIAAPSPDGKLLVTFNALNPPVSLRVAALDATGPRLVLQCEAPESSTRLTPVFKGWHSATAFGLVFEVGEQSKSMPRLAVHLIRKTDGWQLGASDTARLERVSLACRQEPAAP